MGQDVVELRVGATVEIAGGDDIVAGLGEVDDGVEDSGGPGAESEAGRFVRAFEEGDAGFENGLGGIHDPAVDFPEFTKSEEVGRVFGAVEDIRGGAVDRDSARIGGGIGRLPAVEAEGV